MGQFPASTGNLTLHLLSTLILGGKYCGARADPCLLFFMFALSVGSLVDMFFFSFFFEVLVDMFLKRLFDIL